MGGSALFSPGPSGAGDDTASGWKMRISGRFCAENDEDDPHINHWRSVYEPQLNTLSKPAETMFSGDTSDIGHISVYTGSDIKPGSFRQMAPGLAMIHEFLGLERHSRGMTVSYMDGHVGSFGQEDIVHYASFNMYLDDDGETPLTTGEFLIQFSPAWSCYDRDEELYTQIHPFNARFGDHE